MVVRGVGGSEPVKPSKDQEIKKNVSNGLRKTFEDEVSISEDAKNVYQRNQEREIALNAIKNAEEIRAEAVQRGKEFIESGRYKSEESINFVANKISEEIVARLVVEEEDK
jgi:predicted transcriptional regulator